MFEGQRMILKRRLQIRHAGVAGIPRFGEQTQVGQAQGPDQLAPFLSQGPVDAAADGGVEKHQPNEQDARQEK